VLFQAGEGVEGGAIKADRGLDKRNPGLGKDTFDRRVIWGAFSSDF